MSDRVYDSGDGLQYHSHLSNFTYSSEVVCVEDGIPTNHDDHGSFTLGKSYAVIKTVYSTSVMRSSGWLQDKVILHVESDCGKDIGWVTKINDDRDMATVDFDDSRLVFVSINSLSDKDRFHVMLAGRLPRGPECEE